MIRGIPAAAASDARMNGRFAASFCSFCSGEIVFMEKCFEAYNDILRRPNKSNTLVAVYHLCPGGSQKAKHGANTVGKEIY